MSASTLQRPGRRPGALVAVALDPRPCVVNPPQWWDVGDDGNAAAMWLCRKRCPLFDTCQPESGAIRQGTPWGGGPYSKVPNALKLCDGCGHPKVRRSPRGHAFCKCPTPAERQAEREARKRAEAARLAEKRAAAAAKGPVGIQLVEVWLPLASAGLTNKEAAERLGVLPGTLKNALQRARDAGDTRVPYFRRPRKTKAVAA